MSKNKRVMEREGSTNILNFPSLCLSHIFECCLHYCSAGFICVCIYIYTFFFFPQPKALRRHTYDEKEMLSLERACRDLYLVLGSLLACLARIPFVFNLNIYEKIMNLKWNLVIRV